MIKIGVGDCYKDKLNIWENFAKFLEKTTKEKCELKVCKNLSEVLKEKPDLVYTCFPLALELIEKNYQPIAKFKGQKDKYFIIGKESLEKIKNKEKIRIAILNFPFYFFLLCNLAINFDLDCSKIWIVLSNSEDEIIEKTLNNNADLGIILKKIDTSFLQEIPLEVPHLFLINPQSSLLKLIEPILLSLNKENRELINLLGFEEIKILTSEEIFWIKNIQLLNKCFYQIKETFTISKFFLNSPYFGIAIYLNTFIHVNSYLCDLLGYTQEEFQKLKPEEVFYYDKDKLFAREILKRRLSGEFFLLPYEAVLKTKDERKVTALLFSGTIFYKGKYCGIAIVIDITKQKVFEKFINFIGKVNQALITCINEKEIYERVSAEIYQTLELKSLWIGLYKEDKVKPLICYPEKFKDLKAWQALFPPPSENIVIISDLKTSNLSYKDELLSLGIRSICIFSVKTQQEIKSIFILGAEESKFFDEYREFIRKLQINLSFVLEKITMISSFYTFNEFIQHTNEIFILADEKGNIEYINPFGIEILKKINKDFWELSCFKLLYLPSNLVEELEKREGPLKRLATYPLPEEKNKVLMLEFKISLIKLPDNQKRLILIGKDVTQELEWEREKQFLQYFDSLIGLLNFEGFSRKVSELLNHLDFCFLILIDIYNFSSINHLFGYDLGNFCLKEIGDKLKNLVKEKGLVGRTGGDEFALFIVDENIIYWLTKIKEIFSESLSYNGKSLFLEFNASLVTYPKDGKNFNDLWNKLRILLSEAKKKGPSSIEFFDPLIEQNVEEAFQVENLVKRALKEDLFVFYYQPYFETETLKLKGAEVLTRIKDGDKLIFPNKFINYLENSSYFKEFIYLNILKNLEKLKKWKIPLSINLSSKSIKNLDLELFFSSHRDLLFNSNLILEITEHTLIENIDIAEKVLKTIKSFNIKIALDDFGTGYSSITYLKNLPIDIIKIDISFTKSMMDDLKTYLIVKNLINLAKDLGIKTIAEGVETKEQLEVFKELKVDYVQGFYLSFPLSQEELEELLKKYGIIN